MSLLQLDPPSSPYYTEPLDVTATLPMSCMKAIINTDGSNVSIVQTLAASNNFTPAVPYLQVVKDTHGMLVLDGSSSRWWNSAWVDAVDYTSLQPEHRLMANIWKAILNNGTKLLVLGDSSTSDVYPLLGTGPYGFYTFINNLASVLGITATLKDRNNYGGTLNPTLSELLTYDGIMFVSSTFDGTARVTDAAAQAIAGARLQGKGVYICSRYGSDTTNSEYTNANLVLNRVLPSAQFSGNYDFTPGATVGDTQGTYGDNPLFSDVDGTTVITGNVAGAKIDQPATVWSFMPSVVHIDTGLTTVHAIIQDCNGVITYESYGYGVATAPLVQLVSEPTAVTAFRTETVETGSFTRTTSYYNLTRENDDGTPPGIPIWEGGPWFPTTHVDIVASQGLFTISLETLSEFFYEIANYNLVLSEVDSSYTMMITPEPGTPATRIIANALVQDEVIVCATMGRYGTTGPASYTFDGLPTMSYGASSVLLGGPDAWFSDGGGHKFPVYRNGYSVTNDVSITTTLIGQPLGTGDPLLNYVLVRAPDSWTPLPGNPRTGGSIPSWSAQPTEQENDALPTVIIGNRDMLLANPAGFLLMSGNYVPYWE